MLKKVAFLDRDGVINRDSPDYIKTWAEFAFLPRSLDALRMLHENGFHAIVITNQSAINRGYSTRQDIEHIHAMMRKEVARSGGCIHDIFFCPHAPGESCDCRKPRPAMILRARKIHNIDLSAAVMIGDSAKDIACGKRAGCGKTVLVRTGNGRITEKEKGRLAAAPDHIADDLYAAAVWMVETHAP